MSLLPRDPNQAGMRRPALAVIAEVQAAAAVFFVSDAVRDAFGRGFGLMSGIETLLTLGLGFGSIFGLREVFRAERRLQRQGRALAVASGALSEVIETQFALWKLTAAEREVGLLALKGLDNAEIARVRGAATGTVRAQMTHIYQKAGVSGRAQFAAWFVEDLLQDGLPTGPGPSSNTDADAA